MQRVQFKENKQIFYCSEMSEYEFSIIQIKNINGYLKNERNGVYYAKYD